MEYSRKQLYELLNVKESTLKDIIKRKQLDKRLNDIGYKIFNQFKRGRNVFYDLEIINNSKKQYIDICKYVFKTRKYMEFADYFLFRIANINNPVPKQELSDKIGINKNVLTRWDKLMCDNNILEKDGFYYMAIEYNDGDIVGLREADKEEYTAYVKNSSTEKQVRTLAAQFKHDEIDERTFIHEVNRLNSEIKNSNDKYMYKISKYLIKDKNKLYKDILELIINSFDLKNPEYLDYVKCENSKL